MYDATARQAAKAMAELTPARMRLNGKNAGNIIRTTTSRGTPIKIGVKIKFQPIIEMQTAKTPAVMAIAALLVLFLE